MTKLQEIHSPFREGESFKVKHGRSIGKNYIEGSSTRISKEIHNVTWEHYEKELLPFIKDIQTRLTEYLPQFDLVVTGVDRKHKVNVNYTQDIVEGPSLGNEIPNPAIDLLAQLDDLLLKNTELYLSTGRSLDLNPHNLMYGTTRQSSTPHLYAVDLGDPWTKETVKESRMREEGHPIIDEILTLVDSYSEYYSFPKAEQALKLLNKESYVD